MSDNSKRGPSVSATAEIISGIDNSINAAVVILSMRELEKLRDVSRFTIEVTLVGLIRAYANSTGKSISELWQTFQAADHGLNPDQLDEQFNRLTDLEVSQQIDLGLPEIKALAVRISLINRALGNTSPLGQSQLNNRERTSTSNRQDELCSSCEGELLNGECTDHDCPMHDRY